MQWLGQRGDFWPPYLGWGLRGAAGFLCGCPGTSDPRGGANPGLPWGGVSHPRDPPPHIPRGEGGNLHPTSPEPPKLRWLPPSSPEQESDERKCNYERYRGLVQNDFAGSECPVGVGGDTVCPPPHPPPQLGRGPVPA